MVLEDGIKKKTKGVYITVKLSADCCYLTEQSAKTKRNVSTKELRKGEEEYEVVSTSDTEISKETPRFCASFFFDTFLFSVFSLGTFHCGHFFAHYFHPNILHPRH